MIDEKRIAKRIEKALARLATSEGRIARRNARRHAFAVLRGTRDRIRREFPAIEKPAGPPPDPIARKIAGKTWREIECEFKVGRREWDRAAADAFNEYVSALDGHPVKPIRVDIHSGRYLGLHTHDALRLRAPSRPGSRAYHVQLWRVLLHEIAHYREKKHGRSFRCELVRIHRLWREFMVGRRSPRPAPPA